MEPFIEDPLSTVISPRKTKKYKPKTKYKPSGARLSKPALIAIAIVVAVVVIAAIILFIIIWRRRRARAKHLSTLPGYSTDSSSGLYSQTPGYAAGNRYGSGQQQPPGGPGQDKPYGAYGATTSSNGYVGGDDVGGGQGAAADYYGQFAHMQGGGVAVQGREYGGMPQRPPMAFDPSPAPR